MYEEANKAGINALYDKAKIYSWNGDSILHSKFMLVDSDKALIGSVNLSHRSFIQDVENGFVISDAKVTKTMEKIFQSNVDKSEQITKPIPRDRYQSLKIKLLENQF